MHNIEHDNVLFGNALPLAGKPYETIIYPGKSHGVMGKGRTHMLEQQTRFFEDALK